MEIKVLKPIGHDGIANGGTSFNDAAQFTGLVKSGTSDDIKCAANNTYIMAKLKANTTYTFDSSDVNDYGEVTCTIYDSDKSTELGSVSFSYETWEVEPFEYTPSSDKIVYVKLYSMMYDSNYNPDVTINLSISPRPEKEEFTQFGPWENQEIDEEGKIISNKAFKEAGLLPSTGVVNYGHHSPSYSGNGMKASAYILGGQLHYVYEGEDIVLDEGTGWTRLFVEYFSSNGYQIIYGLENGKFYRCIYGFSSHKLVSKTLMSPLKFKEMSVMGHPEGETPNVCANLLDEDNRMYYTKLDFGYGDYNGLTYYPNSKIKWKKFPPSCQFNDYRFTVGIDINGNAYAVNLVKKTITQIEGTWLDVSTAELYKNSNSDEYAYVVGIQDDNALYAISPTLESTKIDDSHTYVKIFSQSDNWDYAIDNLGHLYEIHPSSRSGGAYTPELKTVDETGAWSIITAQQSSVCGDSDSSYHDKYLNYGIKDGGLYRIMPDNSSSAHGTTSITRIGASTNWTDVFGGVCISWSNSQNVFESYAIGINNGNAYAIADTTLYSLPDFTQVSDAT